MGKAGTLALGVAVALAAFLTSTPRPTAVRAQQFSPSLGCNGQLSATPMQGHYTGTWQSDGDYHFTALFPSSSIAPAKTVDLEMKITITQGTLDISVDGSGNVTGTAKGQVDAPIYHDGAQDISSGIGSISGRVSGTFNSAGSLLTLVKPVIDMHWGTFGGGHAVETYPQMPSYTFSVGSTDCVTAGGIISEQGFPDMNITSDGTGQATHAPGIGVAGGTWQLSSDKAAKFHDLSSLVDTFIGQANAVLADPAALTPDIVNRSVVQPFKQLEDTIRQDPDVARCPLEKLGAWEASAVPPLFKQALDLVHGGTLPNLRQAHDLLQVATSLNSGCSAPDDGANAALSDTETAVLDRDIASRSWPGVALMARELVLQQGSDGRQSIQDRINHDLHALLQSTTEPSAVLEIGRLSYALGDDSDTSLALKRLNRGGIIAPSAGKGTRPKATATPRRKTIGQILTAGSVRVTVLAPVGTPPTFSWQAVPGAEKYLVVVKAAQGTPFLWAWAGADTTVRYGDAALPGVQNTGVAWPVDIPSSGYRWSVIALDGQGRIAGLRLRLKP
jgi:hypothetical protein